MRWISAARKIRELSANAAEEALDVDENKDGWVDYGECAQAFANTVKRTMWLSSKRAGKAHEDDRRSQVATLMSTFFTALTPVFLLLPEPPREPEPKAPKKH